MLAMGDEMGRSQQGNNNAYAQDNPISWVDWSLLERHADLHRFVRELVTYRQRRDVVVNARSLSLGELVQRHQVSWHGVEPNQPDWSDSSHAFAVTITSVGQRFRWHAMVNAWWEPLTFRLPAADGGQESWHRWIDTFRASPEDIMTWTSAPALEGDTYTVGPRSIVVLIVGLAGTDG
jgi:glycogen operon protein